MGDGGAARRGGAGARGDDGRWDVSDIVTVADIPIATRRRIALRAEAAALLLRHVAEALDHARPGAEREAGILKGTQDQADVTLESLRYLLSMYMFRECSFAALAAGVAHDQRVAFQSDAFTAEDCRKWAEAWDAWASDVDP